MRLELTVRHSYARHACARRAHILRKRSLHGNGRRCSKYRGGILDIYGNRCLKQVKTQWREFWTSETTHRELEYRDRLRVPGATPQIKLLGALAPRHPKLNVENTSFKLFRAGALLLPQGSGSKEHLMYIRGPLRHRPVGCQKCRGVEH